MKNILSALLVAAATTCANAQYFQELYGTSQNDIVTAGHNAYLGGGTGHFLVGTTDINNSAVLDLIAERTDLTGTTFSGAPQFNNIYQLSFPGVATQVSNIAPRSIEFSNGNGFGIAGAYFDPVTNLYGLYFLTLNSSGGTTGITGYYPNPSYPIGYNMMVTCITESAQNNNELYICGFVRDAAAQTHTFIIKLNQAGTIIWSNIYDLNVNSNINIELPWGIVESANFNASSSTYEVLAVGRYLENPTRNEAFVLRVDYNTGAPIGTKLYGNPSSTAFDNFTSIKNSPNTNITGAGNGYIISGHTNEQGTHDFWFVAIDQAGNVAWSNLFDYSLNPGTDHDVAYDIMERVNSAAQYEYYLCGTTTNGPFGQQDVMVVKTDQNGNGVANGEFWYGNSSNDYALRIDQLNGYGANSDGLGIYGYSMNWPGAGLGAYDFYFVKAYFNGVSACNSQTGSILQYTGPGFIVDETPGIIDQWYDFALNVTQPYNANETQICTATSVTGGSNARQHKVAGKTPGAPNSIGVFPNPVQSGLAEVDVKLSLSNDALAEMKVVDLLGRVYHTSTVHAPKGESHVKLQLPELKPGTYLVTVTSATDQYKTILMVK